MLRTPIEQNATRASRESMAFPGDFEVMDKTTCPPLLELVMLTFVVFPWVTEHSALVVTVGSETSDAVTLGVTELPFTTKNVRSVEAPGSRVVAVPPLTVTATASSH